MPPTINIVRAIPSTHAKNGQPPKIIKHTIERTLYDFEASTAGFFQGLISWNIFTWFYTDKNGYDKPIKDFKLFSTKSYLSYLSMPKVLENEFFTSFTVHVRARYKNQNASQSLTITIHREIEAQRRPEKDGPSKTMEPIIEAVSAAYPGGDHGAKVTYTETSEWTRKRSCTMTFANKWQVSAPALNVAYGFDISGTVSSGEDKALKQARAVEVQIPCHKVGVWYRKVQPYERYSNVYLVDELGRQSLLGEAIVTDYLFSHYLGIGDNEPAAHEDARRQLSGGLLKGVHLEAN
jgi:hypothetical protein